jgi:hypothetical protein
MIPEGTTWLDLVTLLIALVGVVIAVAGFGLAAWRYRRESKVGIRVDVGYGPVGDGIVVVVMTNTERRTVTVQRAGLTTDKHLDGDVFERWRDVNVRQSGSGFPLSDPALPSTLEPGGKPYGVSAGVRSVKSRFHPDVPRWAFCVDAYGNAYWGRVPEDVQAAIRATKRRIVGPPDDWNNPTAIEIEDDVILDPSTEMYD